jgi:hypothetical protein
MGRSNGVLVSQNIRLRAVISAGHEKNSANPYMIDLAQNIYLLIEPTDSLATFIGIDVEVLDFTDHLVASRIFSGQVHSRVRSIAEYPVPDLILIFE